MSDYAPYAPPRRGPNWFLIIGGGCGGCIVLIGLFAIFIVLGFRHTYKNLPPAENRAQAFLGDIQKHRYKDAYGLMSPSAQQVRSPDSIAADTEPFEKKHGKLRNWRQTFMGTNYYDGVAGYVLRYQLNYDHGSAEALFTFRGDGPNIPIDKFDFSLLSGDGSPE